MPSPRVLESILLSLFIRVAERITKCSLRYYNGATRGPGWLQTRLASPKDETECSLVLWKDTTAHQCHQVKGWNQKELVLGVRERGNQNDAYHPVFCLTCSKTVHVLSLICFLRTELGHFPGSSRSWLKIRTGVTD